MPCCRRDRTAGKPPRPCAPQSTPCGAVHAQPLLRSTPYRSRQVHVPEVSDRKDMAPRTDLPAGDARPAHPHQPPRGAEPRPGHRAPHPPGDARHLRGEAGVALPRAPSPRGEGPARLVVGRVREQPPGAVLPADAVRAPPAARRGRRAGPRSAGAIARAVRDHLTGDAPGVLRCQHVRGSASLLRNLLRRDQVERDLDAEVRAVLRSS